MRIYKNAMVEYNEIAICKVELMALRMEYYIEKTDGGVTS